MNNNKFIIYQLLIRVFGNRCNNPVSSGSLVVNGTGKFSSVTADFLNYLKGLGVSYVWYTGVIEHATCEDFSVYNIEVDNPLVVKGMAGSPYAIKDYYDVNPYLADNPDKRLFEFRDLVRRTHEAGLRVIIDFVPNHLARSYHQDSEEARAVLSGLGRRMPEDFLSGNFYTLERDFSCRNFIDSVPDVQKRLYRDRYGLKGDNFIFKESPAKATGNNCFSEAPNGSDWYETVKLNYGINYAQENDTWRRMRDILLFWAGLGVDGFRCDMAEMVPVEFWEYAVNEVKAKYNDLIFIGELYDSSLYDSYLNRGGFDYLYDKEGLYDHLKAISQTCYANIMRKETGDVRNSEMCGRVGEGEGDSMCGGSGESGGSGFEPEGRLKCVYASEITRCWQSIDSIQNRMLNFLENHDEQRIASKFNLNDGFAAIPELVVSLMLNKAPFMLYFGQEYGERGMEAEGYSGIDGRTSIFDWCVAPSVKRFIDNNLTTHEADLLKVYRSILNFAVSSASVVSGDTYDLTYCQNRIGSFNSETDFVFARISRLDINNPKAHREIVIIAVDFTQSGVNEIFIPKHFLDYASILPDKSYSCEWFGETNPTSMEIITFKPDSSIEMRCWNYGISILKITID